MSNYKFLYTLIDNSNNMIIVDKVIFYSDGKVFGGN